MFLANPQILKAGRNVTQDLKRLERESRGSNPAPYTGGVELAKLAKDLGVISDARIGLADICAAVLGVRLDKTTPVRISSSWDSLNLSPQQVEYAASDALVALQVYHCLSQSAVPDKITEATIPGTPVSLHQDDGQVIAYGIISLEPPTSTCRGVNHTPTRARVTVQTTVVPGAILPLHKVSLSSCGPPPFDVLVKCTKLHCRNKEKHPPLPRPTSESGPSSVLPPSTDERSSQLADQELHRLIQFLSQPVPEDADWTDGIDEPQDITEDQNVDGGSYNLNIEMDIQSVKDGLKSLEDIDVPSESAWPLSIRSRVLVDIWHAMARIKISKEHGCRRPFARALRDAIFIPDKDDNAYFCISRVNWFFLGGGTAVQRSLAMEAMQEDHSAS
jgi:hypothetical protein